jgi:allophanate hydrolase subunit 2
MHKDQVNQTQWLVSRIIAVCLAIVSFYFVNEKQAHASLGGDVVAVEGIRKSVDGKIAITSHRNFRMHEITAPSLRIREYLTTDGKVFGVSWMGSKRPDLKALFGSYHGHFQNAQKSAAEENHRKHFAKRSMVRNDQDFHVEMGGRMGLSHGAAWVPSLVPRGFNAHDIR